MEQKFSRYQKISLIIQFIIALGSIATIVTLIILVQNSITKAETLARYEGRVITSSQQAFGGDIDSGSAPAFSGKKGEVNILFFTTFTNIGKNIIYLDKYGFKFKSTNKVIDEKDNLDIEVVPGRKIYRDYKLSGYDNSELNKELVFYYVDTLGNYYTYDPFVPIPVGTSPETKKK